MLEEMIIPVAAGKRLQAQFLEAIGDELRREKISLGAGPASCRLLSGKKANVGAKACDPDGVRRIAPRSLRRQRRSDSEEKKSVEKWPMKMLCDHDMKSAGNGITCHIPRTKLKYDSFGGRYIARL
jgi:hypothetical protein